MAAQHASAAGMLNLGVCYQAGKGMERRGGGGQGTAHHLQVECDTLGTYTVHNDPQIIHSNHPGVPQADKAAARLWLLRAVEAGSTRAHTHLAYLAIEQGDMEDAVVHLDAAAREGDGEAVQTLAQLCKQALVMEDE